MLDHYEKLVGRVTGRAGNAPYPQLIADCNPDVPTHWILARDRLRRFKMRHQDNPTLYDQATGEITDLGRLSMEALHALTGVRRKRGLEGLWVGVEGMVYEGWDRNVHLVDRFEIPRDWRRIRVCDFGYVNPFVCQWWAIDGDLRMYLYRELYMSQRTVATHAAMIKKLSAGEAYEATIADHDAEDRATLRENGIETIPADKRVTVGIEKVQERLVIQGNGKPRLFILRDSLVEKDVSLEVKFKPTNTADEFPAYAWQQAADGKPAKEEPVKVDDHGCLVGDTLIETTEGYKPISKILTGEMVLGREGFVKVTASALTQINAAIWTVVFDNGATLKGTCDHPVWTENGGFVRIDALRYGDIAWYNQSERRVIPCCQNRIKMEKLKLLFTKVSNFVVILIQSLIVIVRTMSLGYRFASKEWIASIERYTKISAGKYLKGAKFITETGMRSIMIRRISNACKSVIIGNYTKPLTRNQNDLDAGNGLKSMFAPSRVTGTSLKRGANGTVNMQKHHSSIQFESLRAILVGNLLKQKNQPIQNIALINAGLRHAGEAASIMRQDAAKDATRRSLLTNTVNSNIALARVVAVFTTNEKAPVYNLTVDGGEYFADSILVHNCDATRYAVMYLDGLGRYAPPGTVKYA